MQAGHFHADMPGSNGEDLSAFWLETR